MRYHFVFLRPSSNRPIHPPLSFTVRGGPPRHGGGLGGRAQLGGRAGAGGGGRHDAVLREAPGRHGGEHPLADVGRDGEAGGREAARGLEEPHLVPEAAHPEV